MKKCTISNLPYQMDTKQLIETWEINNRINMSLPEPIKETNLLDTTSSKERNVGKQFAHIHHVRPMWIKAADPKLLEGQNKIEKESITKTILADELCNSSTAISALLH